MKDATAIAVVIDKSGSMSSKKADVIGGFNEFLTEQQEVDGEATLTMIQFDTKYDVRYVAKDIQKVKPLNGSTYSPGGNTALLDAVGRCIDELGSKLEGTKEKDRPDKVIVVIFTDGQENSSKEYGLDRIKEMIDHQRDKYKWEFLFVGAGLEAFAGGRLLGIDSAFMAQVSDDSKGHRAAYNIASSGVTRYRHGGSAKIGGGSGTVN